MKRQLVLATRNAGKIREFRRILDEAGSETIELVGLENFPHLEDVEETGETFLENALLKAETVCLQTGLPAIADDSGLCVDFLNGDPGIFSARWSGVHGDDAANIAKVLDQLMDVDDVQRGAHFTCVTVLALPNGETVSAEGILNGRILRTPIGSHGFGYDPIFLPEGSANSLAELDAFMKDAISHRGQSLRAIAPKIASMLATLG
ncbi:MAG: RdgB/HAM1 family non-canonical purine NTP pyrophosphatase [Actinobacteria bacterium]|nr:RdgB/HAM1 family non-canonical purine NTP pyrophosphatase [Actinomycetota bacterium]